MVRRAAIALSGAIATGSAMLAAQAMGADLGVYRLGLHRHRGGRRDRRSYKQVIVDGRADDIVYSSLFTGVHGNYLKASIVAAGHRSGQPARGRYEHA